MGAAVDAGQVVRRPGNAGRTPTDALALAVAATALLPYLAAGWAVATSSWLPVLDNALIVTDAYQIPVRWPTTGAYSRFGFDHPGPLEAYLLAPAGKPFGAAGIAWTVALVNAAAALGCLAVAWRRGGPRLLALTSVALALLAHAVDGSLADPWNPFVPLLPFLFCLFAAWGLWCRDWALLPAQAVGLAYVGQAHVGYLPFVAVLVVTCGLWATVRWWRRRTAGRPGPSGALLATTAALFLVLWIPPLAQQVAGEDGNLAAIGTWFTDPPEPASPEAAANRERPPLDQVVSVTAEAYTLPAPWLGTGEAVVPFIAELEGTSWWRMVVPLAAFGAAVTVGWRRHAHEALRLLTVAGTMVVLGVFTVSRISGPVFTYLVRWQWALALVWWVGVAWTLLSALAPPSPEPSVGRAGRIELAGLALAVAANVLVAAVLLGATPPDPLESAAAAAVVDDVAAALPADGEVRVEAGPGRAEAVTSGLIAELARRGVSVVARPEDDTRFELPRVDPAHIRANVRVAVDADADPALPGRPGEQQVGAFDPMSPDERTELEAFDARRQQAVDRILAGQGAGDELTPEEAARYEVLRSFPPRTTIWLAATP